MSEDYVRELHAETREELVRVDGKIATALATFGIVVAIVLAALVAGEWDPFDLSIALRVLWLLGAGLGLVALLMLVNALLPIVDHPEDRDRLRYWGHVAAYSRLEEFDDALAGLIDDAAADRRVEQVWTLSGLVMRKYWLFRRAVVLYGAGIALTGLAGLLDRI